MQIGETTGVISMGLAGKMREVLATLTPREEAVLRERFGVGEPGSPPENAGQDFEATRERIREIEAAALRKLRRAKRPKDVVEEE